MLSINNKNKAYCFHSFKNTIFTINGNQILKISGFCFALNTCLEQKYIVRKWLFLLSILVVNGQPLEYSKYLSKMKL